MPISNLIPTYTGNNVITGQAQLYFQSYNASSPATLPPTTLALGTPWGGSWLKPGATDSGVQLNFQRSTTEIMVEEQATPVDEVTDSVKVGIALTMAESTLQNLVFAFGGGSVTANSPATGWSTVQLFTNMGYYSVGLEFTNPAKTAQRWLLGPCTSVGNIAMSFRRSKDKRMMATSLNYLGPIEGIGIQSNE